jgi:hypothetical protein
MRFLPMAAKAPEGRFDDRFSEARIWEAASLAASSRDLFMAEEGREPRRRQAEGDGGFHGPRIRMSPTGAVGSTPSAYTRIVTERPHYFFGQVLGVDDLEQEQLYHRDKARRHNRFLHGWGIVQGLEVRAGSRGTRKVTISPGYALDRNGEEIVVSRSVAVDLSGHAAGTTVYVAVRYDERPERPVPTPQGQQYTRIRETFAVEVLIRLPRQKPLVVLADVELGRGGKVANIGTARRRYVGK